MSDAVSNMKNRFGLAGLIGPAHAAEFLDHAWPKHPFAAHGLQATLHSIFELPFLRSREALLSAWPSTIQAHLPDVADESNSIDVDAKVARKLFANKMALLFNNVEPLSTELQNRLRSLAKDLGLPTSTHARCMIYATPDGKGTAAHFDQNINFVIQLHGTKKWWLAPNANVENPTERFTIGQELDPELASYARVPMPTEMPIENRQEIILRPGSVLFVPRGWWHCTEATGEALALNFTFSQPTWVDVFTFALRSRLTLSPIWRELADGVTSSNLAIRESATGELNELLAELVDDLPHWQAEDILAATEGEIE